MTQNKFWSKMTGWMRPGGAATASDASLARDETDAARSGLGGLSRARRNEVAIDRLQEGYGKVSELVDAVRRHQDVQDERAAEISQSLSVVAGTLGNIESTNRAQTEKLALIADELRAMNERSGRWEQALAEFPQMVTAQREALGAVVAQLDAVGERDGQLVGSLETLREAVTTLGDATTASSVAVKGLQMSALENQERTAALMQEQNKRFMMLFAVTLVLAAAAVVASLAGLWR